MSATPHVEKQFGWRDRCQRTAAMFRQLGTESCLPPPFTANTGVLSFLLISSSFFSGHRVVLTSEYHYSTKGGDILHKTITWEVYALPYSQVHVHSSGKVIYVKLNIHIHDTNIIYTLLQSIFFHDMERAFEQVLPQPCSTNKQRFIYNKWSVFIGLVGS